MFFIFSSWFSHLFFGIAYDFGFRGTEGLRFYSKIEGFTSEGNRGTRKGVRACGLRTDEGGVAAPAARGARAQRGR